jgi:hypothetical protein
MLQAKAYRAGRWQTCRDRDASAPRGARHQQQQRHHPRLLHTGVDGVQRRPGLRHVGAADPCERQCVSQSSGRVLESVPGAQQQAADRRLYRLPWGSATGFGGGSLMRPRLC